MVDCQKTEKFRAYRPREFELIRAEKYFRSSNKGYIIPSEKFSLKVDNAVINC